MAINRVEMFAAEEEDLIAYNAKAIIQLSFAFYFDTDGIVNDETNFNFPGFISPYLYIYNERSAHQILIKSFVNQLSVSGNIMLLNASVADMTFNDVGKYYYELGYIQTGGYETPLRYGNFFVK